MVVISNKRKENKIRTRIIEIVIAGTISVIIGTVFLILGEKRINISWQHYLINVGYSLNLGLALFANGPIFRLIEKGWLSWVNRPTRSLIISISFHIIYSSIVIIFVNWFWFILLRGISISQFLDYGGVYIIGGEYFILFLVTAIIYAKSFFNEWRERVIQSETLKQEAIALQYQVMQNQVNPHFLFNSLNTLGSLIDIDSKKAKEFTRELSMYYRELLYFKDKDLIPLSEEINFLEKYIYLQKIRFGDNFDVEIKLNNNTDREVIPMSVQMMIENAVKHNIISKEKPLKITIRQSENDELLIENNLQPRENVSGSNKIGLNNLKERYKFLTDREMTISKDNDMFKVTIPLIVLQK